jgi:hypothetical protein
MKSTEVLNPRRSARVASYVLFAGIMQKSLLPPKCACVANGDVCVGDVVIGGS